MANITSIGAGIYTSLAHSTATALPNTSTASTPTMVHGLMESAFTEVPDVREFPSFGAPANIVNVPVYGQAQSDQIQGQADAPTLEFTLNYVPDQHDDIQGFAGDNVNRLFRIRLANAPVPTPLTTQSVFNDFYVVAQVAAFTVSPNLTDSNQATLTLATQGELIGPLTNG